jgi:hypothetical protein
MIRAAGALGVPFDEHVGVVLAAMQDSAADLGLAGTEGTGDRAQSGRD